MALRNGALAGRTWRTHAPAGPPSRSAGAARLLVSGLLERNCQRPREQLQEVRRTQTGRTGDRWHLQDAYDDRQG
ncbi:hypothetical protein TSAR_009683 [Trichomalopsis sarcophagae]|uniref:Uncharacterized protein n=1 Tax=Trichomalopsis sarcophagae TaxID=543379 RepID=A0A232ENK4_9HYME|nr:hypothetical protein TSAR_009683 [Trichomalopsis sarcophagae]